MSSGVRHVLLEARGGPPGARRAVIAPGQRLRVGRTSFSDFQVPGDDALSQEHFEITWDGATCEVRDLGAPSGTLVGGERKDRGTVGPGGWIRAGNTDFSVHFEREGPLPDVPPEEAHRVEYVLSVLQQAPPAALFAVLDAARSERIVPLLQTAVDEHVSLFDGLRAEVEFDGAPYLVRFAPGSRLFPRLLREGWGASWGVYLSSDAPLREVRAHLRRLLVVTRESDNQPLYFRFYDPRVLRAFLPIATPRQRSVFFGPIRRLYAETGGGADIASWSPDG